MRLAFSLAAVLAVAGLVGCMRVPPRNDVPTRLLSKVSAPIIAPPGVIWTDHKVPLTVGATDFGSKAGRATSYQVGLPPLPFPGLTTGIDLFAWGDASIKTAAGSAGISEVEHVDYDYAVILMIFRRFTTEVYGN
jgi:hypothetical protein